MRVGGGGGGAGVDAVLREDGFELLQGGVGSDPRRVKVRTTHPETRLCQVLEELVEPVSSDKPHDCKFRPNLRKNIFKKNMECYIFLLSCTFIYLYIFNVILYF